MARKKKAEGHGGGHGWYVTFADLMALLMAFFVVVAASSTQDKAKMKAALGSMREAFGVQTKEQVSGAVIEVNGVPVRSFPKNVQLTNPVDSTQNPGPIANDDLDQAPLKMGRDFKFATAASTLRQALQDMPEISEISQNILVQEVRDGLEVQIADQDGRSMFPEGSVEPFQRVKTALASIASVLRNIPQRIAITGHTAESQTATNPQSGWDVSAGRANAVRRILAEAGVPADRFYSVTGRSDTEPLYPDNPYLPANRRITITLMSEAPPVPADVKP